MYLYKVYLEPLLWKPPPRQRQIESRAFFAVLQVWFILLILNGLKHLQKTIQPQKLVRDYGYLKVRRCAKDKPILFIESFSVVSPSSYHSFTIILHNPNLLTPTLGFLSFCPGLKIFQKPFKNSTKTYRVLCMGVSKTGGTSKWMVYNGKPY